MIRYMGVPGGSPGSKAPLTVHLMHNTADPALADLTAYFSHGNARDGIIDTAYAIHDGRLSFQEGLQFLMDAWDSRNPAPDTAGFLAAIKTNYPHGVPPDHADPYAAFDQQQADHLARREAIEARLDHRLDVMLDRIDKNLLDAPVGIVRPDIEPIVRDGLAIPPDLLLMDREIGALLAGRAADGAPIDGKHYAASREGYTQIGSYSFVVSPDKSVSVARAMANPSEQDAIARAHTEAARTAMAALADHIGNARYGAGGVHAEPGHIAWIEFTHHTALRSENHPGDPELHTHFMVPNAVFTESGRVGSLDTAALRTAGMFKLDQVYHTELANNLRNEGFAPAIDPITRATIIPAIPREITRVFSKAQNEATQTAIAATTVNGEDWNALSSRQKAERIDDAASSRERRIAGGRDDIADTADWKRQAAAFNWHPPATFRQIKDSATALLERINDMRRDWTERIGQTIKAGIAPFARYLIQEKSAELLSAEARARDIWRDRASDEQER